MTLSTLSSGHLASLQTAFLMPPQLPTRWHVSHAGAFLTCTPPAHTGGHPPPRSNPPRAQNMTNHPPGLLVTPRGNSRSPVTFSMIKAAVFEATVAPISTPAPTAEVSNHDEAAPTSAHSEPLPTTIRPLLLAQYLKHHPNGQYVTTLLSHLSNGFDIGYQGPHHDVRAPNLPSASVHPETIDDYLKKECNSGRMAGPFPQPPFQPFHCSGLGVVPKRDGTWWIITHLSAPNGLSINDYIDPESVTLSYTTVDDAVGISQRLGRGSLLAKIDLKKAFRQCPVRQEDWHLLGLHWRGQFYYDKCLPFGLRSSPFLFDTVASALEFIFKYHFSNPHIIHYLDDPHGQNIHPQTH